MNAVKIYSFFNKKNLIIGYFSDFFCFKPVQPTLSSLCTQSLLTQENLFKIMRKSLNIKTTLKDGTVH